MEQQERKPKNGISARQANWSAAATVTAVRSRKVWVQLLFENSLSTGNRKRILEVVSITRTRSDHCGFDQQEVINREKSHLMLLDILKKQSLNRP
jgi:hypothetical protein